MQLLAFITSTARAAINKDPRLQCRIHLTMTNKLVAFMRHQPGAPHHQRCPISSAYIINLYYLITSAGEEHVALPCWQDTRLFTRGGVLCK